MNVVALLYWSIAICMVAEMMLTESRTILSCPRIEIAGYAKSIKKTKSFLYMCVFKWNNEAIFFSWANLRIKSLKRLK